jgi:hypothetical protein
MSLIYNKNKDFNPKKTKALIISNNTNIPELNIRFNDESVELVDNHKHLGVTFVNFNLRRTFTCFNADLAMFSICTVQFPSDTNVTPKETYTFFTKVFSLYQC